VVHGATSVSGQASVGDFVTELQSFPLLADLPSGDLRGIAEAFKEVFADEGDRILAQGSHRGGLGLILEGQAALRIDGEERARFGRGEFFGEVSAVLDVPVTGDVVALGPVRYIRLGSADVAPFLHAHPAVCYRLLQAEARRLRDPRRWYSSSPTRVADPDWTPHSWRSRRAGQQPT
jgi:CRP-like cAMP-binding protein